jgi:hypothetical protein
VDRDQRRSLSIAVVAERQAQVTGQDAALLRRLAVLLLRPVLLLGLAGRRLGCVGHDEKGASPATALSRPIMPPAPPESSRREAPG